MAGQAQTDPAASNRLERAKRVIRGLLEFTEERGCSEEEAMEAAEKVGSLLKQYDLELTDCIARDTSDMVWGQLYVADDAISAVVTGIARLCSLKAYCSGRGGDMHYKIFGHAPDVELATYLFEVCSTAAEHGWVVYMQRHGFTTKKRVEFRNGFSGRVCSRMAALRAQREAEAAARAKTSGCTSLVLLKDQIVLAEFEKTGIKLTPRKGRRVAITAAYNAGSAHGATVNLNSPLAGPAGPAGSLR